ncbi:MAG: hypothetical protein QOI83_3048 [Streptomycetaceae bacterium]|nr:hypothetical protein [Streptomycetaceae bacterium]
MNVAPAPTGPTSCSAFAEHHWARPKMQVNGNICSAMGRARSPCVADLRPWAHMPLRPPRLAAGSAHILTPRSADPTFC